MYAGIFLLGALRGQAQALPDFSSIPLASKQDFNSKANDAAQKAASYLLATPADKKDLNRVLAKTYLVKWFMGTPDFNFVLGDRVKKIVGKEDDLLLVYTAGICKYALENPVNAADSEKIQLGGVQLFIQYINDKRNHIKLTGELKKLMNANATHRLKEYLQL